AVVFSVYWLLGRKNMNSTRAIFIVIIVAILFSSLGILQKL
ncbi:PTS system mannose/fructose/sorbose family transporter subunit IID, partial [Staphylococcus pseudintermedius]